MSKHEKGHPHDTTGQGHGGSAAPQKKDSFNSDSVQKHGNYHTAPKARQDGKTSGRGADNHAANWTHKHSLPGEKHA